MAGATGLEPAASAVTGQRSNQLSYAPAGVGVELMVPQYIVKARPVHPVKIAKNPYFMRRIDGQTAPESSMRADVFGLRQTGGFTRRVLTMATVPGKAPTPPTVTLKHLAAALAESHEMSKKQAETVLTDLVGNIVKHLKKGERIRIGGLGILQVRRRAARMGRNPATGEQIQIKASKKVAFRASKELKESI
jgi:DNA-binding protein HU-beta